MDEAPAFVADAQVCEGDRLERGVDIFGDDEGLVEADAAVDDAAGTTHPRAHLERVDGGALVRPRCRREAEHAGAGVKGHLAAVFDDRADVLRVPADPHRVGHRVHDAVEVVAEDEEEILVRALVEEDVEGGADADGAVDDDRARAPAGLRKLDLVIVQLAFVDGDPRSVKKGVGRE